MSALAFFTSTAIALQSANQGYGVESINVDEIIGFDNKI